mmetsp:Transcript_33028/g.99476  ORF Transcript_33028/g.99476 Transcript_33028/m.99476 type:complete len:254 (+) Transcript_33028:244-1005(+)
MRKRRDDGWWIDATTATRRCRARSRSASTTTHAVVESRPDVGSSQHNNRGFVSISWPTMRRLRSPPLMDFFSDDTGVSAHAVSRKSSSISSTRRNFSSKDTSGSRRRAEKTSDSRTVKPGKTRSSCSMNATWRLRADDHATPSPYHTAPAEMGPRRASAFRSDVLPQPVGPMSATIWPASTSPEQGARAWISWNRTARCRQCTLSSSMCSVSLRIISIDLDMLFLSSDVNGRIWLWLPCLKMDAPRFSCGRCL